jgi:hypothetical protein
MIDLLRLLRKRRQQNSSLVFQVVPFLLAGAIVLVEFALGMVVRLRICRLIGMKREEKKEKVSSLGLNSVSVGEITEKFRAPASASCDWPMRRYSHVIFSTSSI